MGFIGKTYELLFDSTRDNLALSRWREFMRDAGNFELNHGRNDKASDYYKSAADATLKRVHLDLGSGDDTIKNTLSAYRQYKEAAQLTTSVSQRINCLKEATNALKYLAYRYIGEERVAGLYQTLSMLLMGVQVS